MLNSAFFEVTYIDMYIDAVGKLLCVYLINLMRVLKSFVLVHSKYLR